MWFSAQQSGSSPVSVARLADLRVFWYLERDWLCVDFFRDQLTEFPPRLLKRGSLRRVSPAKKSNLQNVVTVIERTWSARAGIGDDVCHDNCHTSARPIQEWRQFTWISLLELLLCNQSSESIRKAISRRGPSSKDAAGADPPQANQL